MGGKWRASSLSKRKSRWREMTPSGLEERLRRGVGWGVVWGVGGVGGMKVMRGEVRVWAGQVICMCF